jgi:excisionase family DNA binding protein
LGGRNFRTPFSLFPPDRSGASASYREPVAGVPDFDDARLLTSGDVAELFRVQPKTVRQWANAGKLPSIRTLGGHRRYRSNEVRRVLDDSTEVTHR